MRLWPDTLAGRTTLVLGLGVTLLVLVAALLLTHERRETFREAHQNRLSERIGILYRVMDKTPDGSRSVVLERFQRQDFSVSLATQPSVLDARSRDRFERFLKRLIRSEIPGLEKGGLRVRHGAAKRPPHASGADDGFDGLSDDVLWVSLQLGDGSWINLETRIDRGAPPWALPTLAGLLALVLLIGAVGYFASRRLSRPVRELAAAAERFGRGGEAQPLEVRGPREVRRTIEAFNRMQERIERHLQERRLMLAAVSHDLRTPITTLRLRAEYIEDEEMRERTLSTLAHMESMLNDTLAFARDEGRDQKLRRFDLVTLLQTLCDDYRDLGEQILCELPERLPIAGRPAALQRALSNLIGNALRYAGGASVSLLSEKDAVLIVVEDDGPGIPEALLEEVFTPFYRLESSRNSETGGVGLGLAVARLLVHAQGGSITLSNRDEGGLRAEVRLPGPVGHRETDDQPKS